MAETKITQLTISPSIDGTEYLIVDNTEVTRRTTINSLSSVVRTWNLDFEIEPEPVYSITGSYSISAIDNRKQFTYSSTNNITAFITEGANIDNFSCTFSQLDYGSITVKFDPTYTSGSIISINNTDTTITKGASINIKRTANNQFLVSPVFFSLVQ